MISSSPEQTKQIAVELAKTLRGGEVIALEGDLGAGKTVFAQGLCEGLSVSSPVTSPTFPIMNVYEGTLRVVHLDLYRIKTAREIAVLGLEEYLGQPHTVVLIEWPRAVDGVEWNRTLTVHLAAASSTERSIEITRP